MNKTELVALHFALNKTKVARKYGNSLFLFTTSVLQSK